MEPDCTSICLWEIRRHTEISYRSDSYGIGQKNVVCAIRCHIMEEFSSKDFAYRVKYIRRHHESWGDSGDLVCLWIGFIHKALLGAWCLVGATEYAELTIQRAVFRQHVWIHSNSVLKKQFMKLTLAISQSPTMDISKTYSWSKSD